VSSSRDESRQLYDRCPAWSRARRHEDHRMYDRTAMTLKV
jgi:hypothetical protein